MTLVDANNVTLHFSAAVTIDTGVTPDGAFHLNESVPNAVSLDDATHVNVNFSDPHSSGDPWALDSQPNWLLTPVTSPASGTII